MKAEVGAVIVKNKNILMVGLASSGVATVNTLLALGAHVTVNDKKKAVDLAEELQQLDQDKVDFILGQHPDDVTPFDWIVLSPGVPTDLSFIKQAKALDKTVMSELELAYQLCKGKFIAITGTNGKTTTTALTGEIFKNAKRDIFIIGNIGIPAISKALKANEDTTMITEVSSFQLESTIHFKPSIAAILNITPDHLNRHKTMENYIQAKANIFRNQDENDILVLNMDNEMAWELCESAKSQVIPFSRKQELDKGVCIYKDHIVIKHDQECEVVCHKNELKIPGNHNLENALAAVAIAHWVGIKNEVIADTLRQFAGVEHRIEPVGVVDDIYFVNDSKGTNPDASIRAIESIKAPIILIAGGMDKGNDFKEFIHAFDNKVKYMVLIGETAQKIKSTAEEMGFDKINIVKTMEEAVNMSVAVAEKGDTVLLSPGCASWDMYPSFEVRGKHFKACVEKLRRSQ
jgi:UDP-N-acetylmuramoylalanine--D-glutamate ligase